MLTFDDQIVFDRLDLSTWGARTGESDLPAEHGSTSLILREDLSDAQSVCQPSTRAIGILDCQAACKKTSQD
jgi:hypothetical protein